MKCRKCNIELVRTNVEDASHLECPKCGNTVWVISMSLKELKQLGRRAYLDGRHWNRGGGLNK